MKEIVSDFGLAIVLSVIGTGLIAGFAGFIGQISVTALAAGLLAAAVGGLIWI